MLDPNTAHIYNIILSIFFGVFLIILIYIFTNKNRVIIIEEK